MVHLKSGLACVAIFGESPDFLEKSFSGKRKSPDFVEKACFSKIQKSWFFGEILEKDKIRNGKNDWEKHLIRLLTLKSAVKMFKTNFINDWNLLLQYLKPENSFLGICYFRYMLSPVRLNQKSPDFLEKSCFAKS